MSDVIIAIVPAKGHEGLVTEGPIGERPALLYGVIGGGWFPPCRLNEHRIPDGRRALVLYAPGGPRLGMVRAREACQGDPKREEINRFINNLPFDTMSEAALRIWCFAHLMHMRGLASEVLVLPVPS